LALILDRLQSPYNVGAIFRSAAGFRVDTLVLSGQTAPPRDPKVAKLAVGAERFVKWETVDRCLQAVERQRGAGFVVVGVELATDAQPVWEVDLRRDVCFVVGNEVHGINKEVLQTLDEVAFIPMFGRIGSLNVASATAIAMYEARRQHTALPPVNYGHLLDEPVPAKDGS